MECRAGAVVAVTLLTLCVSVASERLDNLPEAKGTPIPQALTSAELRFSKLSDKLLVVRHYGEGTVPLVTVHDVRRDPRKSTVIGKSIYAPLSSAELFSGTTLLGRREGVAAEFDREGKLLVTTSFRIARVWDISKGQDGLEPVPIKVDLSGSARACFTQGGKQLLTASVLGGIKQRDIVQFEVKLWDVVTGKTIGDPGGALVPDRVGLRPAMRHLELAADESLFLTAVGSPQSEAKSAQLWNTKTLKPVGDPLPATGSVFRFSSDATTFLAVSRTEIGLWNIATRKRVCSLTTVEVEKDWATGLYSVRSRPWFAIHPNGKSVLYRKDDHVRLYDMSGEKPVEMVALKHPGQVYWLAISHDGKLAATACSQPDGVYVWNLETGKAILKIPHNGKVEAMEFSPDGLLLATANAADVQLWDLVEKKK